MSALPPIADMCSATRHVRFVPIADILDVSSYLTDLAKKVFYKPTRYRPVLDRIFLQDCKTLFASTSAGANGGAKSLPVTSRHRSLRRSDLRMGKLARPALIGL
jgi:hypothetical protein